MTTKTLQENIHTILENDITDKEEKLITLFYNNHYEQRDTLVEEIITLHHHPLIDAMDPQQKQMWSLCLGFVAGILDEGLEKIADNIKDTKKGEDACH